jgi:hypothetical protein
MEFCLYKYRSVNGEYIIGWKEMGQPFSYDIFDCKDPNTITILFEGKINKILRTGLFEKSKVNTVSDTVQQVIFKVTTYYIGGVKKC